MATVFLAHDLRRDRAVALKVLHPELAATMGPEASSARSGLSESGERLEPERVLRVSGS
jgi:hypothetical protein